MLEHGSYETGQTMAPPRSHPSNMLVPQEGASVCFKYTHNEGEGPSAKGKTNES